MHDAIMFSEGSDRAQGGVAKATANFCEWKIDGIKQLLDVLIILFLNVRKQFLRVDILHTRFQMTVHRRVSNKNRKTFFALINTIKNIKINF